MDNLNTPQKENGMDPIVIQSLIVLATQIAGLAIKYNDPNMVAPTAEAVMAHLAEFKKLTPLPETVDEGFVSTIMDQIYDYLGKAIK